MAIATMIIAITVVTIAMTVVMIAATIVTITAAMMIVVAIMDGTVAAIMAGIGIIGIAGSSGVITIASRFAAKSCERGR